MHFQPCVTIVCFLQVNLYMSELDIGEYEDILYTQKDYNHLYWYMVTVIVFYGIPAFQLVITYQQVGVDVGVVMSRWVWSCSPVQNPTR